MKYLKTQKVSRDNVDLHPILHVKINARYAKTKFSYCTLFPRQ